MFDLMHARLTSLLRLLRVRDGEAKKVGLMFLYLLMVVATIITGRITRDALFVTEFDEGILAYMYITVAICVPTVAVMYTRVADRFRRDRLIVSTLAFCALSLLVLQVLVLSSNKWVLIVLYNWTEVVGAFLIIQFWTFASDVFSSREAKRLYPIIGGGGIVASTLCGLALSTAVKGLGIPTEWLLTPQVIALLACIIIVRTLAKTEKDRLQGAIINKVRDRKKPVMGQNIKDVFESKHLRIIAGMTVATFLTVPLIDYQFKVLVTQEFTIAGAIDTDGFSTFMGVFYSVTGLIAAGMQLFLTQRMLERFGVVVSLLILPLSLMAGTAGMAIGIAVFSMSLLAKGAENAFRYSIYDATMQVIYTPVPGHIRGRAKTLIDGILKPLAGGAAGITITLLVKQLNWPVTRLSYIALGCVVVWFVLILRIRKEYVQQLLASLRRRRLDFSKEFEIEDPKMIDMIIKTLDEGTDAEVRNVLELAQQVRGRDLSTHLVGLLDHADTDIRVRALKLIEKSPSGEHADRIKRSFDDDNNEVVAQALRAFCALRGERAAVALAPFLEHDSALVRGAAVAALIRHGGLDGVISGTKHLDVMREHSDEAFRFQGALIYQEIRAKKFYAQVLRLMNDESLRVQNAAITAAGQMQASELIPALIYKLSRTENARCAAHALASFGEGVIDTLSKVLTHSAEDLSVRRQVPKILERIGSKRCLEILMKNLDLDDPDARFEAARAAARLRHALALEVDGAQVKAILDDELSEHYQQLAALSDLKSVAAEESPNLLRDAIEERLDRSLDRIFRLLGILHPLRSIELVYSSLQSQSDRARANAIEALDNLLDIDVKRRVLPLVEDISTSARLRRGKEFYKLVHRSPEEWIGGLLRSREPWLVSVALHMTSELSATSEQVSSPEVIDNVIDHLTNADPVVRETAIKTLASVAPDEFLRIVPEVAENDADPRVRRFGSELLKSVSAAMKNDARAPIIA